MQGKNEMTVFSCCGIMLSTGCEQTHAAEDGSTIEVVVQDMGAVRTKKAELQGV